ncbi:hypothetical protein GQ457_02G021570 [Hibiscus cannabinus]
MKRAKPKKGFSRLRIALTKLLETMTHPSPKGNSVMKNPQSTPEKKMRTAVIMRKMRMGMRQLTGKVRGILVC